MKRDPSANDPQPPDLEQPGGEEPPPAFDKEAARRRYRATMRGPFMRSMTAVLILVLLVAWGFGIAAVFARDVEALPGHDLSVPPSRCVTCHTPQSNGALPTGVPPMPHAAFPSCGFCHRQSPPQR